MPRFVPVAYSATVASAIAAGNTARPPAACHNLDGVPRRNTEAAASGMSGKAMARPLMMKHSAVLGFIGTQPFRIPFSIGRSSTYPATTMMPIAITKSAEPSARRAATTER